MEHYFELPVEYKGEGLSFKGRLVTFGYVYKFHIVVNGEELIFEKDDEDHYRVVSASQIEISIEKGLLEAIIHALNQLAGLQ